MLRLTTFALFFALCCAAPAASANADDLPELTEDSAKGLTMKCVMQDDTITSGGAQPVVIYCTITNTTKDIKPIRWNGHSNINYLLRPTDDTMRGSGAIPMILPQLREPLLIRSDTAMPGYILYLPPGKSMRVIFTYRPKRPHSFKGRLVYDPVFSRPLRFGDDGEAPPWQDQLVESNVFSFEVVEAKQVE